MLLKSWVMGGATCLCLWSKFLINSFSNLFPLKKGNFPANWKRGNVVPVQKKGNKDLIHDYGPVSLLPIFSKIYETCIYNALCNYFDGNDLFSKS